jgi:acetoin utilization deacetylase AcuC-like enzyme
MEVARGHAHDRVVSVLEGGYDLEGLSRSVARACDRADGGVSGRSSSPRERG